MIEVEVSRKGLYGYPVSLSEHIEMCQSHLEQVPEPFRDSAAVALNVEEDDGHLWIAMTISYKRPETPEETSRKEAAEKRRSEQARLRDIQTLRELLALYGPPEEAQDA